MTDAVFWLDKLKVFLQDVTIIFVTLKVFMLYHMQSAIVVINSFSSTNGL